MSHARALQIHSSLCQDLTGEALAALRREVREHYDQLLHAQRTSELLSIDIAELLCTRLEQLLDAAPSFSPPNRAAVVGAACYFVSNEDAVPDYVALTGLDDDVLVFNTVVRAIGRPDLVIDE